MRINETLDVLGFGIKYYENGVGANGAVKRMNLLEYFSLTDYTPQELTKIAHANKHYNAPAIAEFGTKYRWKLVPLDVASRVRLFYAIGKHEFTPDEKLTICEKLQDEGYPLYEGVWELAAQAYHKGGIDAISKEVVSKKILDAYETKMNKTRATSKSKKDAMKIKM